MTYRVGAGKGYGGFFRLFGREVQRLSIGAGGGR